MNDLLGQEAREALGETTRRCSALNRNGDPCGRAPILGGFVCDRHGGKTPAVQRSARQRLLALVDPAMAALQRALQSFGPPCDKCGRSDADRDPTVIRAAQIVLDRAGFHPSVALEVNPAPEQAPWASWLTHEEMAQISGLIARAKVRMHSGEEPQDRLLPVVVDDDATEV